MQTIVLDNGRPSTAKSPVLTATDISRRYGEGDTAVDALRGVSLEIANGQPTAGRDHRARQVDADAHPRRLDRPNRRRGRRSPASRSRAWRR